MPCTWVWPSACHYPAPKCNPDMALVNTCLVFTGIYQLCVSIPFSWLFYWQREPIPDDCETAIEVCPMIPTPDITKFPTCPAHEQILLCFQCSCCRSWASRGCSRCSAPTQRRRSCSCPSRRVSSTQPRPSCRLARATRPATPSAGRARNRRARPGRAATHARLPQRGRVTAADLPDAGQRLRQLAAHLARAQLGKDGPDRRRLEASRSLCDNGKGQESRSLRNGLRRSAAPFGDDSIETQFCPFPNYSRSLPVQEMLYELLEHPRAILESLLECKVVSSPLASFCVLVAHLVLFQTFHVLRSPWALCFDHLRYVGISL